jgi:hypothetical protein
MGEGARMSGMHLHAMRAHCPMESLMIDPSLGLPDEILRLPQILFICKINLVYKEHIPTYTYMCVYVTRDLRPTKRF